MSTSDSVFLPSDENTVDLQHNLTTPGCLDRFSRFNIFIRSAIEQISSGVSDEHYIQFLGKLSVIRKAKSAPAKMQKRMRTHLMDSLLSEIIVMVEEENIKEKLQKLDKLVDESMLDEGQETWRPNGNVNDHVRSHLMEVKLKHKDKLEQAVGAKEQDVECVLRKVNTLRTHVRSLETRLLSLQDQSLDSSIVDKIDKYITEKVENLL